MTGLERGQPLTDTRVYAQDAKPTDTRDGVLWVDTADPARTVYVYSVDSAQFERVSPETSISRTDSAVSFTESDVTLGHSGTKVANGYLQLLDQYLGSTASRPADNSTFTNSGERGIYFKPNKAHQGVRFTLSGNNDGSMTTLYVRTKAGTLLDSVTVNGTPGEVIEFTNLNLTVGNEYSVSGDAGGASFTAGNTSNAAYPYTSGYVDITAYYNTGNYSATSSNAFIISDVEVFEQEPQTSGTTTIEFPSPPDINAWDVATFIKHVHGGTAEVDVIDGAGNVKISNISRGHDISALNPGTNVGFQVRLTRPTTADASPHLHSVYRRWSV